MGTKTLIKSTIFNLKTYRLYWMNILSVTVILPLTYLAVVIFFAGGSMESIKLGLTGFVTMTCFTTIVYPLSLLIANIFEEQVLELHASLPVSIRELLVSNVLAQIIFATPPILIGIIALALICKLNILYVMSSMLLAMTIFSSMALLLGISIKNRFKLEPILTLLMLLVVIATPLYYGLSTVNNFFKTILLLNPVTHIVCLLRLGVGLYEDVPPEISYLYLVLIVISLVSFLLYKTRGGLITLLERR